MFVATVLSWTNRILRFVKDLSIALDGCVNVYTMHIKLVDLNWYVLKSHIDRCVLTGISKCVFRVVLMSRFGMRYNISKTMGSTSAFV
jgi:hypothetical protein